MWFHGNDTRPDIEKNEQGGWKYWAIFGGAKGNTVYQYAGTTFKAYNEYATGLSNAFFIGSSKSYPKVPSH